MTKGSRVTRTCRHKLLNKKVLRQRKTRACKNVAPSRFARYMKPSNIKVKSFEEPEEKH